MFNRLLLMTSLFLAVPLLAQVESDTATPATQAAVEDTQMRTPPPVSGADYPTTPLSQERSNYLSGGVTFNTSYDDNVLGGTTSNPVSDISYSIWPSIALDETTTRLHWVLNYSPGFTFYQRTSSRNQADQNVGINLQYRLSPHVTVTVRDSLQKSSSYFSQPDLITGTPVSGSAQAPTINLVAPLADRLSNTGGPAISYQFSANGMVGASGTFNNLHYSDATQAGGLSDSSSMAGAAFYSRRVGRNHYIGGSYQYSRILSYPTGAESETQTHTIYVFYTIYLSPTLSLSFSGGPQYADVSQGPLLSSKSWNPAATVSAGWQAGRTGFAASYSHTVSGGGGLLGAFHSNAANASIRQQLTRNWNAALNADYSINKSLTPFFFQSTQDGHSISGGASVQRNVGRHLSVSAGYSRLHQSYSGVAAVAANPDTNREFISISYQFQRPLGR